MNQDESLDRALWRLEGRVEGLEDLRESFERNLRECLRPAANNPCYVEQRRARTRLEPSNPERVLEDLETTEEVSR